MTFAFTRPSQPGDFFVVGGTLRRDAPSYVPRRADEDLFEALTAGRFCYVLTPRQMGKSSLMVRTAARLREAGATAVVLDLTEIGQNLTAEQWYKGLLGAIGEELDLEDELNDVWRAQRDVGPMRRWMRAVREVVLDRRPGQVVVFIDEIDAVRSLPFSTDEFFAGIRELYNRRAEHPDLERLTFCLLGVASPADLIRDTRTTPFNIGQRIELADFAPREALALARGLGKPDDQARALVDRVMFWTGGHPYLTQRLCQAVAERIDVTTSTAVDRLCDELFLSRVARERDDNLLFVRDRLLRGDDDVTTILELYDRVLAGARVPDDEADACISALKLSGVVRVESGTLRSRNRIYEHVFDRDWVATNIPGAEVRRQKRAFKKGLLRAAGVAVVAVAVVGWFAFDAIRQRNLAQEQTMALGQQQAVNRRLLYVANINLAYQSLARGDYLRAAELLEEERAGAEAGDPRDFEYYRLWRIFHSEARALPAGGGAVFSVAYSPDGARMAASTDGSALTCWDAATGAELWKTAGEGGPIFTVAFSPDGSELVASFAGTAVRIFDAATGRQLGELPVGTGPDGIIAVAYAPGGRTLATGNGVGVVSLWDRASLVRTREIRLGGAADVTGSPGGIIGVLEFTPDGARLVAGAVRGPSALVDVASGAIVATFPTQDQSLRPATITPDGSRLLTVDDNGVALRDPATGYETGRLPGAMPGVLSLDVSPDGRRLALARGSGVVDLWDIPSKAHLGSFPERSEIAYAVAFSPDGQWLASGSRDGTVKLRRVADGGDTQALAGHGDSVYSVVYSRDGATIAAASFDGSISLWDAHTGERLATLSGHTERVRSVAFSPDGRTLVSGSDDDTVRLWDVASRTQTAAMTGHEADVFSVAFSPDGTTAASGGFDGTVRLWDVAWRAQRSALRSPGGSIECVAYSPDGRLLAAGGEDHVAMLWDAKTGIELGRLQGHRDWINAIAFSPDGKLLATVGSYGDGSVRLWDVESRKEVHLLRGFTKHEFFGPTVQPDGGRANAVAFSPKGTIVALTSVSSVKLFDVLTGQEMAVMGTGHERQLYTIAFAPDGSALATGAEDGSVRIHRAMVP